MSVYIGDVQTFAGVIADKPQVLKIGEEAMEVFSAWEDYKYAPEFRKESLIDEIADVIQAACNLLAAIGVDDMRQPMQACYVRNKERGREYASSDDMDSAVYVQKCTNESCRQYVDQGERAELPDCESDSREKLEAEIYEWCDYHSDELEIIAGWLDRQAAITKSECANLWQEIAEDRDKAQIERDELQEQVDNQKKAVENFRDMWQKADTRCSELQAKVGRLTAEHDAWRNRFDKVNREKCDLQSRDTNQRHNNLLNRLRGKGVVVNWDDSRSDYMVLLNNCDAVRELQEQNENQRAIIKDLQQERVTVEQLNIGLVNKSKELREENDGLKARIESLRAKLSKMLDAASEIQHIGDLP